MPENRSSSILWLTVEASRFKIANLCQMSIFGFFD